MQKIIEHKCLSCDKSYEQKFNEKLKKDFLIHINLLAMIPIKLFYCYEKVLILMNISMIGKNSMKHHYQENKIFIVT